MTVKLMTPGPTEVLESARLAMAGPMIHHRTEPFRAIVRQCRDGLKEYYRTTDEIALLAGSGTAGMEAALVSLLSPGDRVLVASCGKFGDRWAEIARAYGLEPDCLRTETGAALDAERVAGRAKVARPRALCVTAHETSVGVKSDLEAVVRAVRQVSPDTLVLVDAITALGAYRFETSAWGLDAVVCGSQKTLALPPGLAFVSLSARAREAARTAALPRFYLNLHREIDKQMAGETGFTPAISLVVGLRAALAHWLGLGMERVWAETARLAAAARAGLGAAGLRLVPTGSVSESVTAAWLPEGTDGGRFVKDLEEACGFRIAGGQGELKGKIVRIAHFGPITEEDTLAVIQGIESLLVRAGRASSGGAALAAARTALQGGAA